MAKERPCISPVGVKDCPYPAKLAKRKCGWHWLLTQPADVQRNAALARLAWWDSHHAERKMRVPKEQWPKEERWCSGCQSFVPLFYCSGSRCKSCASSAAHTKAIEDKYGITEERYQELFKQQNGRCAICRNRPRTQRLAVDHDHKTGEVRGLLCKRCNHDLLGGGHDDFEVLWRALVYLMFPPAQYPVRPDEPGAVMRALTERLAMRALLKEPPPASDDPPPF